MIRGVPAYKAVIYEETILPVRQATPNEILMDDKGQFNDVLEG